MRKLAILSLMLVFALGTLGIAVKAYGACSICYPNGCTCPPPSTCGPHGNLLPCVECDATDDPSDPFPPVLIRQCLDCGAYLSPYGTDPCPCQVDEDPSDICGCVDPETSGHTPGCPWDF